jgi:hypothetical protein
MGTRTNHQVFVAVVTAAVLGTSSTATEPSRRILDDRGPVQSLDLYWGNTSAERAPVGPFTFLSENLGGTQPKAILVDANGVRWNAKWGNEVQPEVAATRLAWAVGLNVEETYYVEDGQIVFPDRRPSFHRLGSYIDKDGRFRSAARFERRDANRVSKGHWSYGRDLMTDEDGYTTLVLMDVVMANWDAKNANHKILSMTDGTGTTDWYMVGDYGACFGKMGGLLNHSKFKLRDYVHNKPVITSVRGETVHLGFSGTNASAHATLPIEGVRLFATRAAALSVKQIEDAFRAAHASGADLDGFADATYQRMQEAIAVSSSPS